MAERDPNIGNAAVSPLSPADRGVIAWLKEMGTLLGEFANGIDNPVRVIGSFSVTDPISATGVGVNEPCVLVRIIVLDKGTSGTVQINDDPAAASGRTHGPIELEVTGSIECGFGLSNGAYVTLTGSPIVQLVYQATS